MKPFPFWRSIAYADNHSVKVRWHAQARAKLRALARELGLEPGTFDIRSNYGGIAVSGEATLHGEHVHVQVSQFFGQPGMGVLYRRCKGRKDYCGAVNHYDDLASLNSPDVLAGHIERDLGPCYKLNPWEVAALQA